MSLTRRDFLSRASALGAAALLPRALAACSDGDGLPRYRYDGPLGPEKAFEHGVASGDPLADAVVLWTRVTVAEDTPTDAPLEVFVEVAEDAAFTRRVLASDVTTTADADHTVRVDATELAAGATYYYRFSALGRVSPIGRTRTAAEGQTARLRFGVASCSNMGFGYFYAYRHLARVTDLDGFIHLGDYLYEYGAFERYGEVYGGFREDLDPPWQIVTLDDYRRRYAFYRRDPDLAELHRQNPMIHVWDDHEFACDPYVGGAVNHFPNTQGPWDERVAAALQAYAEWMPTRLGDGGRIYRHLVFGDLVDLVMLDRQRRFIWPGEDDDGEYLGAEQQAWLDARIAEGTARWLLLGQGTTFAPHGQDMVSGASWDAASRERVLAACEAAGRDNLVVLTGDIHRPEALDIVRDPDTYAPGTGNGSAGVEFACGSITSPGSGRSNGAPQFLWADGFKRTYLVVTATPDHLQGDFFGFTELSQRFEVEPEETYVAGFRVDAGGRHARQVDAPVDTNPDAPALAPPPEATTERA